MLGLWCVEFGNGKESFGAYFFMVQRVEAVVGNFGPSSGQIC